jgi:hypothetical protein
MALAAAGIKHIHRTLMMVGGRVVLAVLAAGTLCAQDAAKLEILGELSEIGASSGIGGAQITLYQFSINSERSVFAKGVTDSQGYFEFHPDRPGRYYIEAAKPEYVTDSGEVPTARDRITCRVEQGASTGRRRFSSGEVESPIPARQPRSPPHDREWPDNRSSDA